MVYTHMRVVKIAALAVPYEQENALALQRSENPTYFLTSIRRWVCNPFLTRSMTGELSSHKVSNNCAWAYVSDIFFNGTARTLVIYGEFRYISRIFPTLFSKLISIFIFLLNTFSMGEKTRARLTQERTVVSIMRNGVLSSCVEPSHPGK